jgi:hypothetical protein
LGATDAEKSELLKDVLAMANAWRETNAHIGIAERAGGQPDVVGIGEHLDDADLQQFINSKTNRPVQFSYFEFQVGLIWA